VSVNSPLRAEPSSRALELAGPGIRRETDARTWFGLAALLAIIGLSLLVVLSAADTNAILPESIRPVPSFLAGAFGDTTLHLPVGVLLPVLSVIFGAYLVAVRCAEHLAPTLLLAAIAALLTIVVLGPLLFSTDVFSYEAYARMYVSYGSNPYLHGPTVLGTLPPYQDYIYNFIGSKWITMPTAYGPVFTVLSVILDHLTLGLGSQGAIGPDTVAYKASAALACLFVVVLLWRSAKLRGVSPVRAAAVFGLNPLIVLYGVGGGHNDLLMIALTTAGVYALLARRDATSGALVVLGAALKLTGLLILPFQLAAGGSRAASTRKRILIGALLAAVVTGALGFAVFGVAQLNLIPTLSKIQSEGDSSSVPGFIEVVLGFDTIGRIVGYVLGAAFLALCAWLLLRVWRGEMDWIEGAAWATFAILVSASSMEPWYVCWLVPLVALVSDQRLWKYTLWLTGVVQLITMVAYIPHGNQPLAI
jgi:hypothetical protein